MASLLLSLLLIGHTPPQAQIAEVIAQIRIQGNVATPDDEVLRLAGVEIGMSIGPETIATIADRLRATKRFERVDVLKRYASISDPTRIVLVLLVDEGRVAIQATGDPNQPIRVVRRRRPTLQLWPVLGSEDGYGATYGVRVSKPGLFGKNDRLFFPVTWGGEKLAAAEFEAGLDSGVITRIAAGVSVSRKTHPFYQADDDRRAVWIRGERQMGPAVRLGGSTGWQHVSFLGATDRILRAGVDVVLDTRLDPWLARNAIYVRSAWDRLAFQRRDAANRFQVDAQGYLGAFGQAIVVVRALRDGSDTPLPGYLKPILGGAANVRGFAAGTAVGDTLVAGSLELRAPLTSPFRVGKIGVSGFFDAAAAYDHGQRLADQPVKRGVGGSVWFTAAVVRLEIAVAHGAGTSTRMHVSGNLSF